MFATARAAVATAVLVAVLPILWRAWFGPELLIVGPITEDVVDGARYPGGAVSYAATVASALGARACIVTTASADAGPFPALEGHDIIIVPSNRTLTFEHTYTFWGEYVGATTHILSAKKSSCVTHKLLSLTVRQLFLKATTAS